MTFEVHQGGLQDAADAADWVVRLSSDAAGFDEFEAFDAWLAGGAGRAAAYDRALVVWTDVPMDASVPAATARPAPALRRRRPWPLGVLAGAGSAVAAVVLLAGPLRPAETYATGPGERRDVALADGSRVRLNADSRIAVRLRKDRREVSLDRGEAAFDVAHDASRPFLVRMGARSVRVVGTEFDIERREPSVTVTVRRGVVDVRAADAQSPSRLTKGDQLSFASNDAAPRVRRVDPDAAFLWGADRLVYRDATLGQVVRALNGRFGAPNVAIDAAGARLPFSGVLVLDSREQVVRRLTMAAPLSAETSSSGIRLRIDQKPRP